MKINIKIDDALDGHFSKIYLSYTNNRLKTKTPLVIQFQNMFDFSKDTSSIAFDFFLISSIVYGIDKLIDRKKYSVDGWAREFEVCFPVEHLKKWNKAKQVLIEALSFLTGDHWDILFEKRKTKIIFCEKKGRWQKNIPKYDKKSYQFASLFSGGLDSLIGVINNLEEMNKNKKVLVISHFDSNSSGTNSDQEDLYKYLSTQRKYKDCITWIQSKVTIGSRTTKKTNITQDHNYRSRSLLFISLGCYLISSIEGMKTLLIPENGTISLNFPLTPSRSSSMSTRTTHPYFIHKVQELLATIDLKIKLNNPYSFCTKGEMVTNCKNKKILEGIYEKSVSCGKRGRSRTHWEKDKRVGVEHCGACIPCLNRRAALNLQGWDNQKYGYDLTKKKNYRNDYFAIIGFLKNNFNKEQIERGLLVNGSLPLEKLSDYADVVIKSRNEMLAWIKDKGNKEIVAKMDLND